jgi:hypothetical protein
MNKLKYECEDYKLDRRYIFERERGETRGINLWKFISSEREIVAKISIKTAFNRDYI